MKSKFICLVLTILFLFPFEGYAEKSMRRCMLLPIKDSMKGAIGFKVFEEVEAYLKSSEWCFYKHNSEILNILGNYKKNLSAHLENKEVLKLVAEKTDAGSLIKIELVNQVEGVDVSIKIFGDNGEDVYFKEATSLTTDEIEIISQTIKNWLDVYEKTIPYDGKVIGVLGHQFTVDIGKHYGMLQGTSVKIVRPVRKKKHPLLKEIVDWETLKIANAKIFHATDSQAQGKVKSYEGKSKVHTEDWVIIDEEREKPVVEDTGRYEEVQAYEFGKLGQFSVAMNAGTGSDSITTSGNTNKLGGFLFGASFDLDIWATRNYFGSLELMRNFGSYEADEGSFQNSSYDITTGRFKAVAGYKYLPLGFFYGPQVDLFAGYGRYSYGLDTQTADNITKVTFKGILLGVKGTLPVMKELRLFLDFDFIFKPTYTEETTIFGEDESSSNYNLEVGAQYVYNPAMTFDASVDFSSSSAEFESPTSEVNLKETLFKIGASFTF